MAHFIHFFVGFGLLLHVLFWGAGAAILAVPPVWRRLWPAFVVPLGLALQAAVVWCGALAGLEGTNSYAWASEIVPVVLLVVALWRHGVRAAWVDISRFGLVWLALAGALALLILPLAIASRGLTTISLGSCDAADYAAGARVLQEFARDDRTGFLGLAEVVRVQSVDNFFDYWIRLNHFTPSALLAFNGTIFDCAPHELASLLTMVLVAGTLPVVFWVSRAVLGYNGGASLGVMLLYGVSPINWYAVAHVAPGQVLAAQAIALLTWAGVALWRGRLTMKRSLGFAVVLGAGYWLVLGSYNFILVLCLVPAVAVTGGFALWRGEWARFGRWLGWMLLPLVACAVFFFERVAGLAERFTLLQAYDFGWKIPALSPEGWLGMVRGPGLEAWDFFGLRWVLTLIVGVAFAWAMHRAVKRSTPGAWVVVALTVPVLAGYTLQLWRGAQLGTNGSYYAYKLIAVFYPLLLPAFCWWVTLRRSRRVTEWLGVVSLGIFVLALNLVGVAFFIWHMARPPLLVDGELRQLRKIEAMADVASVNHRLPAMWDRLWANAFLLRKPQYFLTHTYEGRLNTPLRGEWDLQGGLIQSRQSEFRELSPRYSLVRAAPRIAVQAEFGEGWHAEEHLTGRLDRWRWSKREATLRFENPRAEAAVVALAFDWRALHGGRVTGALRGAGGALFELPIGPERTKATTARFVLPPGKSELVLRLAAPGAAVADDARELGVCIFKVEILAGVALPAP